MGEIPRPIDWFHYTKLLTDVSHAGISSIVTPVLFGLTTDLHDCHHLRGFFDEARKVFHTILEEAEVIERTRHPSTIVLAFDIDISLIGRYRETPSATRFVAY